MTISELRWLLLVITGLASGLLAKLIDVGGGIILVPVLLTLGHSYSQSVAASIFAISLVCLYRSFQNWRTSNLQFQRMSVLEFSAIVTVLVSTSLVNIIPQSILEIGFSFFFTTQYLFSSLTPPIIS
jgi:uncharacterized membrane protein YfcA